MNQIIDQKTATLNKESKIKQKETKQYATTRARVAEVNSDEIRNSDAIVFYQENFGIARPFLSDEILSWVNDLDDELVIEGMKRALERGKFNFGYVKGILNSWVKQGISSVEMLEERKTKKQRCTVYNRNRSKNGFRYEEVVPDWFLNGKRKKIERQESVAKEVEVDGLELLKEYLSN